MYLTSTRICGQSVNKFFFKPWLLVEDSDTISETILNVKNLTFEWGKILGII